MAHFLISSSNTIRTTLHRGSHSSTVTTLSDGSVDHLNLHVDTSFGVIEPSAPDSDSDDTKVQSPSAVASPQLEVPYMSSYQEPLNDEARTKKQEELFHSIIDDKLGDIPVRLIDTTSGKLCSTGELHAHFKESRSYKEVEMKILRANQKVMKATVDAFFEYAMFSHRWSTTIDDEPTYDHIKGEESIYNLKTPPGIDKLQQFCKVARENQFRWAWSDTCCIDKTNNVELQESIISMFSWYRLSSVTIVYLSDVIDEGSFRNSVWFTRGWTLQELIAPRLVWFYKKDWTPYIDSKQNHKEDPRVVKTISEVTSIDRTVLNQFVPGLRDVGSDEVKKRMSWLASRKTAKIEDMAYCMMGIFGVHMPVMYGERKNAFVRLQKEIMTLTDDLSLFDWVGEPSELHSYFASHPSCFANAPAGSGRSLSKLSHPRLFASKVFASAVGSTIRMNIKKLLLDPPHGHFIANGKMNIPLFVHEVTNLIPADATCPPTLNDDGSIDYLVTAEGLAEVKFTTHKLLPIMFNGENSPRYRLVRMWDSKLIPSEDDVKKVDEETGSGSGDGEHRDGDDEHHDGDGKHHEGFIHTPHWLDKSDVLSPMTAAVSHNAVVTFMSRLRQPFVAQLLIQTKQGRPYERVGTRERLIAVPSSGSITFRGIRTLSVR